MEISILNNLTWLFFIVFITGIILGSLKNKKVNISGFFLMFCSYIFYCGVCYKAGLTSIGVIFIIHSIVPIYSMYKIFKKKKED